MHCCSYFCRDPTNKNKTRQRTPNCTWPPHRIKLAIHQDYAPKRIMVMLHQQSEKAEKNHTEKKTYIAWRLNRDPISSLK
jgi:hypothetical protein